MKRLMIMPVVLITAFLLCGCGIFHTYNDNLPGVTESNKSFEPTATEASQTSSENSTRYTVTFDVNETFVDEPSRLAAERIDPVIKQAVEILNTILRADHPEIFLCSTIWMYDDFE